MIDISERKRMSKYKPMVYEACNCLLVGIYGKGCTEDPGYLNPTNEHVN